VTTLVAYTGVVGAEAVWAFFATAVAVVCRVGGGTGAAAYLDFRLDEDHDV
jgi:hypothetical protein